MGSWNENCALSGLPISYGDRVVAFIMHKNSKANFSSHSNPCKALYINSLYDLLPLVIRGHYDEYGSVHRLDINSAININSFFRVYKDIFHLEEAYTYAPIFEKTESENHLSNIERNRVKLNGKNKEKLETGLYMILESVFDQMIDLTDLEQEVIRVVETAKLSANSFGKSFNIEKSYDFYDFSCKFYDKLNYGNSFIDRLKFGTNFDKFNHDLFVKAVLNNDVELIRDQIVTYRYFDILNDLLKPILPTGIPSDDFDLDVYAKLLKVSKLHAHRQQMEEVKDLKEDIFSDIENMDDNQKHTAIMKYVKALIDDNLTEFDDTGYYTKEMHILVTLND